MAQAINARPVYLVDFSVYKPPEELRMDSERAKETAKNWSVSLLRGWWLVVAGGARRGCR